jgi:hypothetical protein
MTRTFIHFHQLLAALMFAICLRVVAADDEGLVIVDAKWKSGTREANVTSKIRARVHDDSVRFLLSVDTLGDPYKYHPKVLHITYRYHGVAHTTELPEGWTLSLPEETAEATGKTFGGNQKAQVTRITDATTEATKVAGIPKKGLEIVQAVFGTDGIWLDVTATIRGQMKEGRWKTDLHRPFSELGGDPAKGRAKQVIVGYLLDGAPKVAIIDVTGDQPIPVSLP